MNLSGQTGAACKARSSTRRLKAGLRFQRAAGWCATFLTAPLVYLLVRCARYRVRGLGRARATVKRLYREHDGPWLICANHLTLIDSLVIAYAMAPFYVYMIRYRRLPWNLPEKTNFDKNFLVRLLVFLYKCIPVVRGGDREAVAASIAKCRMALESGESVLIFPEGTRSRTGRIDTENFSYGAGRLFLNTAGCRIMCVYLRGEKQKKYSSFPARNQDFHVDVIPFRPEVEGKGLRAQRECARQIINVLADMEKGYFDGSWKRRGRPFLPSRDRQGEKPPLRQEGPDRAGAGSP